MAIFGGYSLVKRGAGVRIDLDTCLLIVTMT